MFPQDPESFNHKWAYINGIRMHYVEEGPADGPLIVLSHGYPDFWYGWRNQIPYLAAKGYHVICPDQRGFGQSYGPYVAPGDTENLKQYGWKNITKDLADLLTYVSGSSTSKAIFLGHDWGGIVVWRMAGWYPERVRAVAAVCTPYDPPKTKWFCEPQTDTDLLQNAELYFKMMLRGRKDGHARLFATEHMKGLDPKTYPLGSIVTQKDIDYYVLNYKRSGFHAPLNWYRTREINYKDELVLPKNLDLECLMVIATQDPALPPSMAKNMSKYVKNCTYKTVEAAHWMGAEQPAQLNAILGEWLDVIKTKVPLKQTGSHL
ncbi:hypothetical protein SmJEL517_g02269 [Synchytrium microbalum]|uniref:AB hydrolase-1 domain-containing protein n=1 Tax=Synchytrium microbalum TaxID=1806994 RepID=A0A507C878_9FUNG|nr:uncharacterized protein SmJEL517_g02269 [Synchytrium microbalum]TPX35349.1 hypothetical protein SmJEL517_g02269 [Synchytrium microbalum]